MPRAADGVGKGWVRRSTFVVGEVKQARSPQTVTEISMFFHHLHVLLSALLQAERTNIIFIVFQFISLGPVIWRNEIT